MNEISLSKIVVYSFHIPYEMLYDNFDLYISEMKGKDNRLTGLEIHPIVGNTDLFEIELFVESRKLNFENGKLFYKITQAESQKDSLKITLSATNKNNGIRSIVKNNVELK